MKPSPKLLSVVGNAIGREPPSKKTQEVTVRHRFERLSLNAEGELPIFFGSEEWLRLSVDTSHNDQRQNKRGKKMCLSRARPSRKKKKPYWKGNTRSSRALRGCFLRLGCIEIFGIVLRDPLPLRTWWTDLQGLLKRSSQWLRTTRSRMR